MIYLITNDKDKFDHLYSADITFAEIDDILFYFKNKEEIEFDTETTGLDVHSNDLISAQFGDNKNQFVVDSNTIDIREFKVLLENKLIIMQNAKFDLKFLYKYGIFPTKVYDTLLAESVLNMGNKKVRKGLDHLTYRYCNISLDKTIRGSIHKKGFQKE